MRYLDKNNQPVESNSFYMKEKEIYFITKKDGYILEDIVSGQKTHLNPHMIQYFELIQDYELEKIPFPKEIKEKVMKKLEEKQIKRNKEILKLEKNSVDITKSFKK